MEGAVALARFIDAWIVPFVLVQKIGVEGSVEARFETSNDGFGARRLDLVRRRRGHAREKPVQNVDNGDARLDEGSGIGTARHLVVVQKHLPERRLHEDSNRSLGAFLLAQRPRRRLGRRRRLRRLSLFPSARRLSTRLLTRPRARPLTRRTSSMISTRRRALRALPLAAVSSRPAFRRASSRRRASRPRVHGFRPRARPIAATLSPRRRHVRPERAARHPLVSPSREMKRLVPHFILVGAVSPSSSRRHLHRVIVIVLRARTTRRDAVGQSFDSIRSRSFHRVLSSSLPSSSHRRSKEPRADFKPIVVSLLDVPARDPRVLARARSRRSRSRSRARGDHHHTPSRRASTTPARVVDSRVCRRVRVRGAGWILTPFS